MASDNGQKIARLTPFIEVVAALKGMARPVQPREVASGDAAGFVLAQDVFGPNVPVRSTAIADGWAVIADQLIDASGYAPVRFANAPVWVEAGDDLPPGTDAVAPPDIVVIDATGVEVHGTVTAGEGVALVASEIDSARTVRSVGARLRVVDAALFEAAGIAKVQVRVPRVLIVPAREDLRLRPSLELISSDCAAHGAAPLVRNGIDLKDILETNDCDAIVVVGGTGVGRRDQSVQVLAKIGQVVAHGVGLMPGETTCLGQIRDRPVLIVPGQIGSAIAPWLTLGRTMLAGLTGQTERAIPITATLSRKIPSTVGVVEVALVRHDGEQAEPLAIRHLPLQALAQANGWLMVPAESEGFPSGAEVAIYSLP